jgi:ABC-type branched-subunit amino acid transport system permease subunit
MDDKRKLFWMKLIGGVFIAGIIIFLASIFIIEITSDTFNITLLIILIPAILIILVLLLRIKYQSEGIKSGLPIDDEMSKRIKERAGYLTYLITMYFVLALMWYNLFFVEQFDVPQIPMNYLIFGILFFMFIVFGINWAILNKQGMI